MDKGSVLDIGQSSGAFSSAAPSIATSLGAADGHLDNKQGIAMQSLQLSP